MKMEATVRAYTLSAFADFSTSSLIDEDLTDEEMRIEDE